MSTGFLFVHSKVDDAGLDASEFRVVCHLYRRQNTEREGYAWPGKKSIARTCRLNEKTVERVLKSLVAKNVISEDRSQTHQGAGVFRKVNHPDCWLKSPHTETDPRAQNGVGVKEAPEPEVNEAPHGVPNQAPQRVSIEGDPFEGNPVSESKDDAFNAFWKAYPKKVNKGKAEAAWKKIKPEIIPAIMEAVEVHKKTEQWKKDDGAFIPNPMSWLDDRRWEDEIKVPRVPVIGGNKIPDARPPAYYVALREAQKP